MPQVIQPLFDGPLDLVGDIHGEIEALDALMSRLGYDRDGRHPEGRKLGFVGDLVDRGADSAAVVERVATMVDAGRAQAVLGNHELNLLLNKRKEGNGWFYEADHDQAKGHFRESARPSSSERDALLAWLGTLPLALERDDLRLVHACWDQSAIKALRADIRPVAEIYRDYSERVDAQLRASGLLQVREEEKAQWGQQLHDKG